MWTGVERERGSDGAMSGSESAEERDEPLIEAIESRTAV